MSAHPIDDLTSPDPTVAHEAAIRCFDELVTDGSAHGAMLPAALKVRAASLACSSRACEWQDLRVHARTTRGPPFPCAHD